MIHHRITINPHSMNIEDFRPQFTEAEFLILSREWMKQKLIQPVPSISSATQILLDIKMRRSLEP